MCEEPLRQVLGIARGVPKPTGTGIKRRPVALAQPRQRCAAVGCICLGGVPHETPPGRREFTTGHGCENGHQYKVRRKCVATSRRPAARNFPIAFV